MAQQDAPAEGLTTIKSIGVIGAGQMGSGIAHVCALAGYDVRLSDVSAEQAKKALDVIAKNMDRQDKRGKIGEAEKKAALKRTSSSTGLEMFDDSDIVTNAASKTEET